MEEPFTSAPRPCSTPHSAPVAKQEAGRERSPPAEPATNFSPAAGAPQPAHLSPAEGPATLPTIRHDGWTGEKIATFCEALAETAVVAEACDAAGMGISGAYAARRRNPLFAAAWDAALSIARERLADTLLARAMEGNVELIWRDGIVVGERHVLDNRLGLAILRRLDRLAETGATVSTRGERFVPAAARAPAGKDARRLRPASDGQLQAFDWRLAIDALRAGDDDAVAAALALTKSYKVEEVEDPPVSLSQEEDDDPAGRALDRCWQDDDGTWMTDFPPPPGFTGDEYGEYGDFNYERDCTPREAELLSARETAADEEERAEDEAQRDALFAMLREEALEAAQDRDDRVSMDGKAGLSPQSHRDPR